MECRVCGANDGYVSIRALARRLTSSQDIFIVCACSILTLPLRSFTIPRTIPTCRLPGVLLCDFCVQICDFLSSHPTQAREWRVLHHYLLHELEQHPAVKAEEERAKAGSHGGAGSSMLEVMQQQGSGRQVRALQKLLF